MNSQSLARGLAFFSLGLGAVQILAPRQLARAIGVDEENENLMRLLGLREMGAGLGIMQGYPAGFVWARVGGDVMDLALLGNALRNATDDQKKKRLTGAIAAVAGVTALDILGGILLSRNPSEPEWRVAHGDRSGMPADDRVALRQYSDQVMAAHQSGHLRQDGGSANPSGWNAPSNTDERLRREENAIQSFEPGD